MTTDQQAWYILGSIVNFNKQRKCHNLQFQTLGFLTVTTLAGLTFSSMLQPTPANPIQNYQITSKETKKEKKYTTINTK